MTNAKLLLAAILSSALATSAAAAPAIPAIAPWAPAVPLDDELAVLRDRGPAGLAELLAKYDAATTDKERGRLAPRIDAVAAQRYASVSRLYWYTDLEKAKAAAAASGKPILELRMLGRLDEDLSCANSRLFRATLYANQAVAKQMREDFVLLWTSERPVPKVTIDFGDGRTLSTTITGNSAHYVLAADGTVLDVLPGMYAPDAFRTELGKSAALARIVAAAPAAKRATVIKHAHAKAMNADGARLKSLGTVEYIPREQLTSDDDMTAAAWRAQRATMSKAYIEVPQLAKVRPSDAIKLDETNTAAWAALGQAFWGSRSPAVLDDTSRALVLQLQHANQLPGETAESDDARIVARLEQHLVADSALNQLRLRKAVHQRMEKRTESFAALNGYVYAQVFHTPATDPWLGLVPRTDFTGVPGDGARVPVETASR